MPEVKAAWWNLENLFDSSGADRDPALASALRSELAGWTVAVRDRKLDQLARVIVAMFDGDGPDLLGVCEVENETVLGLLADRLTVPGRDYRVVSHPSPDTRGIDVSFIIDRNVLEVTESHHQVVVKRAPTRDIFWIDVVHRDTGRVFVAMGNHWPARSSGQYESEPFRLITGETLSFRLAELMEAFDVGSKVPIIIMGDFNDEPFNRSMQEYFLGSRDPGRVTRARSPICLNLMWPLMAGTKPGTHKFGSDWNMLDQILVTKGMLRSDSPVKVRPETTSIVRPDFMLGSGGKPRRFGRPSKSLDEDGVSDHFPITVLLEVS
jgi:endonuclease/exonuclease/phosphatase family metal-dependent hydrolase